jgi:hypothetical protein
MPRGPDDYDEDEHIQDAPRRRRDPRDEAGPDDYDEDLPRRRRRYEDEDDLDLRIRDVPSYLALSIITTLLCCWPLGIVAIIFSAQVNTRLQAGDTEGAVRASNTAKVLCILSFVFGLLVLGLVILGHVLEAGGF